MITPVILCTLGMVSSLIYIAVYWQIDNDAVADIWGAINVMILLMTFITAVLEILL